MFIKIFPDMTGGSAVFFLASYSYISDVSEEKSRTKRFAYLDGLFPLGFYTAQGIAGPIKTNFGLIYNFAIGMLCAMICFAYVLLFVKESTVERDKKLSRSQESSVQEEGNVLKFYKTWQ